MKLTLYLVQVKTNKTKRLNQNGLISQRWEHENGSNKGLKKSQINAHCLCISLLLNGGYGKGLERLLHLHCALYIMHLDES